MLSIEYIKARLKLAICKYAISIFLFVNLFLFKIVLLIIGILK